MQASKAGSGATLCCVAAMALLWLGMAGAAAGTGNYLIVTAEEYDGSAPLVQFANAKAAMGFTVSTYVVPDGTSRDAIKGHIQSLWGTPDAPDYILLVGDTDGSSATVNTIPHWVGQGSRNATTDLPYACMDPGDDWYPDIYIGRFSVRSVASLQNVVDKTLALESGNWPDPDYVRRAAFLATDDSTAQANQIHDFVIDNYLTPAQFTATRIYANQGGGTSDVTQAVNDGVLFCVYFGHSSSSGWWTPGFNQSNVNALSNVGLYGLAMGWSCNTAHFDYDECFGETWLRAPNKGAAAYLSASNYVWWGSVQSWESSRRMERYFFEQIFVDQIWEVGPAWQAACYKLLDDPDYGPTHDHTRNIFEEFVLLGDPALLLPGGSGFTLNATPPVHELCTPPANQAVYSIDVGQVGDFDEIVTLSVAGVPASCAASFGQNDLAPPFTTTLTIDGIDAAAAGDHVIDITGTTVSMSRAASVELLIVDGAPAAAALLEPGDGATGVALRPTLSWQALAGASGYDVELATDVGFNEVIFTTTTAETSVVVDTALDMLTRYYWRVRAANACGAGSWSPTFSFLTVNMLMPQYYNLLNGETGSYTYFDDSYDGFGNNTVPLEPLTNGLGDLTDGVLAVQHWNQANEPYVGWKSIEPTITFYFERTVTVDAVSICVDDTGGGGGVVPPSDVTISMGGSSLQFAVVDPPNDSPFTQTFDNLGLSGDMLELTLHDDNFSTSRYMMLSEVAFFGGMTAGDTNCDGVINAADIDPFVLALTDPAGYAAQYPACHLMSADCNSDGAVNAADIDPFVQLVVGP